MKVGDLVRLTRPGHDFKPCLGIIVDKDGWGTMVQWFGEDLRDADDITVYTPDHGWKVEVVSAKR